MIHKKLHNLFNMYLIICFHPIDQLSWILGHTVLDNSQNEGQTLKLVRFKEFNIIVQLFPLSVGGAKLYSHYIDLVGPLQLIMLMDDCAINLERFYS